MSESLLPNEVPTVVESNEAQDGANDASDEASSAPNVEATSGERKLPSSERIRSYIDDLRRFCGF